MTVPFSFDNSYSRLPERFYARLPPTRVAAPSLIRLNTKLAERLGLNAKRLAEPDSIETLAGNRIPEGAEPLAMAYAGHQFGNWVPQLGDGRAILLGEIRDPSGTVWDIQLKGAGPTPFSRRGDGRAALGPVIREYVISEAMSALGIPTTYSLAMVATGEVIQREEPLPGAVLTRVSRSHVRVGTFEYFARQGDVEGVKVLADYVVARLYPEALDAPNKYRALLDLVITRQAVLVAQWLGVGFIHGVMNTDNMSIAGETIDYGPCAFMDTFHPATVFSSIDQIGRYAYGNQPGIAHWNLLQLAQALLPLLGENEEAAVASAQEGIDAFPAIFRDVYLKNLTAKIGLATHQEDDERLAQDLLNTMSDTGADFTLTFRYLCDCLAASDKDDARVRAQFSDPSLFDAWARQWRERLKTDTQSDDQRMAAMRKVNPLFIPRNHRVEAVIAAAHANGDRAPLDELLTVLSKPYDDQPTYEHYAEPPKPEEVVQQTFCGT